MRKLFSLFMALLATTSLWAYEFKSGDLFYTITSNSAPYTVKVSDAVFSSITTATIPSTVIYNGTTYSVTSIGEGAFGSCGALNSVTIPNSVTNIGDYAFYNCSFLTSVTIPNSVTSIGEGAFYDCLYLTSITIPENVTNIGDDVFHGCYSLDSIVWNAKRGPDVEYDSQYTYPIFSEICSQITSFTFGEDVEHIPAYLCYGLDKLNSITIPNSVTSIGERAFGSTGIYNDNSNWENGVLYISNCLIEARTISGTYTIKENTRLIADHAFYYNYFPLTSITIPKSVTSIGEGAFANCDALTKTNYTGDIAGWCDIKFDDASANPMFYSHNFYINDQEIKDLVIPNTVDSIHNHAFHGCNALTSVTIGNSVTSIGDWAFNDCSSLTSLTIPNSVTSIGDGAFYNCSSLTSITIPKSVTSIGEGAFANCDALTKTNYTGDIAGWCDIKFDGCFANPMYYSHNFYINDQEIKDLVIPNTVDSIHHYAFYGCSSLSSVAIGNGVTEISKSVFAGCTNLNLLRLGTGIQSIAAGAFADCTKLYDIYCLAAEPPTGYTSSFANYNAFLHVPCESQRLYMLDVLFGEFKYIECIASDEVSTDDIVITPGLTDVTIIWPSEDYADTYTIIIKKGDEVFCTLTFNAEGQLLNIAFAPGRDGNHPAQYAEQAGKGFRFTVTGLEEATDYTYDITVKDASNKTINSHSGKFTTESLTAVDDITINNANIQKILRNGQLIIVRDGVVYNAMGQEM